MFSFKTRLAKNYINAIGWRTKRKLLLIESDDWGSIRMPSFQVYKKLLEAGIEVDKLHIDKFDSIERSEDLNALYSVLTKHKDKQGYRPVVTAYYVVANPDFERIEACGRKEYHYESIQDTYNRSPHTAEVHKLIRNGIEKGIFIPQFHGREHIHINRWLAAINSGSDREDIAFKNRAIISTASFTNQNSDLLDYFKGFDYVSESEHSQLEQIHRDGLKIFREIFGYSSKTFMAQGSVWGDHLLSMLKEEGVQMVSGQQQMPDLKGRYKTVNRKWGTINKYGQIHWRRNCLFEPARDQNYDWVNRCMEEISIAFRWGKPAVISSHRENFIGSIFPENRERSLEKLDLLLSQILIKWPEVEFISTPMLAEIMMKDLSMS